MPLAALKFQCLFRLKTQPPQNGQIDLILEPTEHGVSVAPTCQLKVGHPDILGAMSRLTTTGVRCSSRRVRLGVGYALFQSSRPP